MAQAAEKSKVLGHGKPAISQSVSSQMLIFIEDSIHCERIEQCASFEEAIARLQELAELPWDQDPNRAPCVSWRKCGREYQVIEYDTSTEYWKVVRAADVLNVSASIVEWVPGFEEAWTERLSD